MYAKADCVIPLRKKVTNLMANLYYSDLEDLGPPNLYEDEEVNNIIHQQENLGRNIANILQVERVKEYGADIVWLNGGWTLATHGGKKVLFNAYRGPESRLAASLASDKYLTNKILSRNQIATTQSRIVSSSEEVLQFHREISAPIVVKPRFSFGGKGVSLNLDDDDQIVEAFASAREFGEVIVEKHIHHTCEFRCMATSIECVSIMGRLKPWVMGNGTSTITELINAKNEVRNSILSTYKKPIPINSSAIACLADQGLTLDSILPIGKTAIIHSTAWLLAHGCEAFECFPISEDDSIRKLAEVAVAAVRAIPGLNWAGIDIILTPEGEVSIIEVNVSADILAANFPHYGTPVSLASHLVQLRMKNAQKTPSSSPRFPVLLSEPKSVYSNSTHPRLLSSLLMQNIRQLGWKTKAKSPYVALATNESGEGILLQNCRTAFDPDIAVRAADRHNVAYLLLEEQKIPRAQARFITSQAELLSFFSKQNVPIVILPFNTKWDSKEMYSLEADEDVKKFTMSSSRRWIVQARHPGRRYQVIATAHEALAVLGDEGLSWSELAEVASLAVYSIRAIPELRWASVEVVIPESKLQFNCIVEGINTNPSIEFGTSVLAGSLDDVCHFILADAAELCHQDSDEENTDNLQELFDSNPIKSIAGVNRIFTIEELCSILSIGTPSEYLNTKDQYITDTILFEELEKKGLCKKQISTEANYAKEYYQELEKKALLFKHKYHEMKTFNHSNYELVKLYTDYLYVFSHLGYTPFDYFTYELYRRNLEEANTFINRPFWLFLIRTFNQQEYHKYFENKVLFHDTFGKYIKREWLYTGNCSLEEFTEFVKRHPKLIAKPTKSLQGRGIKVIESEGENVRDLFIACHNSSLLVEEIISNIDNINNFNVSTVNTVRICTLLDKENNPTVVMAAISLGRKGNIVDNHGAGGIIAIIDVKTGKVISDGMDKWHVLHDKHPDSGKPFKGFQVPHWHKIIQLAKDAAVVVPQVKLVGWDIAITDGGHIELIEGNHNPSLHMMQKPDQIGRKYVFQKHLDELGVSEQ